ncbi:ATPase, T2SS/T4P/T4SS family (plasmid) [Mesorhizobium atlanticum]|uniref:ATPase, T2SS/T4P/T4SS family n=1 Tax=Mesorhizobium atlanticum TaxID=2233532 RepID=UPI003703CF1D
MLHDTSPMEFLQYAVRNRVSIVVSGGTSTGKTTFLNALLKEIPAHERIITIEDTRESEAAGSQQRHPDSLEGRPAACAKVSAQQLLEASLRMRPDPSAVGRITRR